MANFYYTEAKNLLLAGSLDFDADDMRVMLVMTGSDAATLTGASLISDYVSLTEYDGSGYTQAGVVAYSLAGKAVTTDVANDRGEFDATDYTFTAIGAGTGAAIIGIVLYKYDTSFLNSKPVAYFDISASAINGNGGNLTLVWNAEGIIQAT